MTLGALVGKNLASHRLRVKKTQREAAAILREHGLNWSPGNLAQLETGRRASVRMEELVLMSAAFGVDLVSWFGGDPKQRVALADGVAVTLGSLRGFLANPGSPLMILSKGGESDMDPVRDAAGRLGVTVESLEEASLARWGRSFLQERDRRVGDVSMANPRSVQAWRGHATRTLVGELRERLGGSAK